MFDISAPRLCKVSQRLLSNGWFWLIFVMGLLLRLAFTTQPLAQMVLKTLPDDGFYYFVIARSMARGLGWTSNGLVPTNGFHPLWALFLEPLFLLVQEPVMAIRWATALGAVVDVVAALILTGLAERVRSGAGIIVAYLYLFNPYVAMEAVNGLETPLAVFVLGGFLYVAVKASHNWNQRVWVALGLSSALVFLARSDLAIVVACVWLGLSFQNLHPVEWSSQSTGRAALLWDFVRRRLVGLFVAGIIGLLVILPWFVRNYFVVGHIAQSSGVAIPLLVRYRISLGGALWEELYFPMIYFGLRFAVIYPGLAWIGLIIGLVASRVYRLPGISAWLEMRRGGMASAGSERRALFLLGSALMGISLVLGIHIFVRWYPRGWYYVPLAAVVSLLAGILLARMRLRTGWAARTGLVLCLLLVTAANFARAWQRTTYPGQDEWLEAAAWLNENLPQDAVIGAFNAGIVSYFSGRPVVNLDGVVDWQAIEARQQHRLLRYLTEHQGYYLIDRDGYVRLSFWPFLGPEVDGMSEVRQFGGPEHMDGVLTLYELTR